MRLSPLLVLLIQVQISAQIAALAAKYLKSKNKLFKSHDKEIRWQLIADHSEKLIAAFSKSGDGIQYRLLDSLDLRK
jgi:hypothetical protein